MEDRTQAEFELLYDGEAVQDGSMNVRDLAPSMLAIGALFEAANNTLNGSRASVNVNVKATSANSFHIAYEVIQAATGNIPFEVLMTTAIAIKDFIFGDLGIPISLFFLIKWLAGRRPKIKKISENSFKLTIDKESYEVPLELLKLYQDLAVRKAVSDIVQPIKQQGIDRLEVRRQGSTIESVTKADIDSFEVPTTEEKLIDQTTRHAFTIVSLSFREDNKWRLTDGEVPYTVSMKDAEFQRRVDNNVEAFSKGDILICELHTVQWQISGEIKTEHEIIKVHEHKVARQLDLFEKVDDS